MQRYDAFFEETSYNLCILGTLLHVLSRHKWSISIFFRKFAADFLISNMIVYGSFV